MSPHFIKVLPKAIKDNAIEIIGYDWMLITAGDKLSFNTMTAAWGSLGFLWQKPVAVIYIRPQRYTYEFTEKYDHFTLSFFDKSFKKILNFCGTNSGRDVDKIATTGLTPAETDHANIYFTEARLIFDCKKLYYDDIDPDKFLDPDIHKVYPAKDYHRMYIGEIIDCLIKQ